MGETDINPFGNAASQGVIAHQSAWTILVCIDNQWTGRSAFAPGTGLTNSMAQVGHNSKNKACPLFGVKDDEARSLALCCLAPLPACFAFAAS